MLAGARVAVWRGFSAALDQGCSWRVSKAGEAGQGQGCGEELMRYVLLAFGVMFMIEAMTPVQPMSWRMAGFMLVSVLLLFAYDWFKKDHP
jgi:hypothetical protein